ncbi:MAG: IS110 family transposase, partial [Burkholderiales bacterium]
MTIFAGLDVSDKTTHVCVVDAGGGIAWRGVCATDPDVIAKTLGRHARGLERVVLETGPLSVFLYHGLAERAVPVTCICARHAKKVLSVQVNKSDPHDAEGLAHLARTGWYKAIRIKGDATHMDRARLKIREQLVKARIAMLGQLRGLMKLFGLRMGTVTTPGKRAERLGKLFAQKPELKAIMAPLIASLEALESQIAKATRALEAAVSADPVCERLMTVPGVGPITALTFKSSIEDPGRFARGSDAGAYAGLVPRRNQSGERDTMGRISKAGDGHLRGALYE